jgi:tetratricopeptide (TPR) repeat protein
MSLYLNQPQDHDGTQEDYYDLGSYHRQVTTSSKDAQIWFDRGLVWTYAFNHEEAVRCFHKAIVYDPSCAMTYWGLAYALGPNYNKPWDVFDVEDLVTSVKRTHIAAAQAKAYADAASPVERALIEALQFRYMQKSPTADFSIWNQEYAQAMGSVYQDFPNDLDVATIYVDALMNLTPWEMWDIATGKPATGARTLEVKDVLEKTLSQDGGTRHPGVLHLYIHLMEMSSAPETALTVADHLRGLVPDAGHLNHMPSHLDILCGDYRRAIASNSDAIQSDAKFLARDGPLNFYTLYRSHNYHFRIYAAMFSGQSRIAIDTVAQLEASIPEALLRVESPPMADWLESFLTMRMHVLVRFGRWQDILSLALPQDQILYCVTIATIHYAQGIAYAATGQIEKAENSRTLFRAAVKFIPPTRTLFNNTCIAILAIAAPMLDGELAYRTGDFEGAFTHFGESITLSDSLPYDEPWGWMHPPRHVVGALLLEQNRVEEAAAMYSADLGFDNTLPRALQHPNNIWALHGYHECLVKLGRTAEARIVEPQLRVAVAIADVLVSSSCFCRRGIEKKSS